MKKATLLGLAAFANASAVVGPSWQLGMGTHTSWIAAGSLGGLGKKRARSKGQPYNYGCGCERERHRKHGLSTMAGRGRGRNTWAGVESMNMATKEGFARLPHDPPAMEYVTVPIVSHDGLAKEQLVLPIDFPSCGVTLNFTLDTLAPRSLISPGAVELLGIERGEGEGSGTALPAARLGDVNSDHFLAYIDAVEVDLGACSNLGHRISGVLGLDFLSSYDLDFNFAHKEMRVYISGALDQNKIDTKGLEEVRCNYLPGGRLGLKMELNSGGPFTGILDISSNCTVGNWAAARDVDVTSLLTGDKASAYPAETGMRRPLLRAPFDTVQLGHTLLATDATDKAEAGAGGQLVVYVGYLPAFDELCKIISSRTSGERQLALIGLDLIGSSRFVLSAQSKRLYFKLSPENDPFSGQF
ncbi:unnamed protein product [Chrysoparadoxa australica]